MANDLKMEIMRAQDSTINYSLCPLEQTPIEKDKGVRDRRDSIQRTEGNHRVQCEMNTCPQHPEQRCTVLETADW